jgi:hypothetical protein
LPFLYPNNQKEIEMMRRKVFIISSVLSLLAISLSCSLDAPDNERCMHSGICSDESSSDFEIVSEQYESAKQNED